MMSSHPQIQPDHDKKEKSETTIDLKIAESLLEALDREIDFYRKRAGQIFFFGLLVEVLILAGKEKILLGDKWPSVRPVTYSLMFIAVAAIGIILGREYRARIHKLKESRSTLLQKLKYQDQYPDSRNVSEIRVMYFVLVFLSSIGIILVWLTFAGNGYENVMVK